MTQNTTADLDPEKATDFVQVNCWFPDDPLSPQIEMIHRDDLPLFIKAQVSLHVDPGVDPVTKKKQKFLERITVSEMLIERGCWFTMPNLGEVTGEKGARRLVEGDSHTVWLHPDYAAEVEADYAQQLRIHRRDLRVPTCLIRALIGRLADYQRNSSQAVRGLYPSI